MTQRTITFADPCQLVHRGAAAIRDLTHKHGGDVSPEAMARVVLERAGVLAKDEYNEAVWQEYKKRAKREISS